jgi:hypothetical protein
MVASISRVRPGCHQQREGNQSQLQCWDVLLKLNVTEVPVEADCFFLWKGNAFFEF